MHTQRVTVFDMVISRGAQGVSRSCSWHPEYLGTVTQGLDLGLSLLEESETHGCQECEYEQDISQRYRYVYCCRTRRPGRLGTVDHPKRTNTHTPYYCVLSTLGGTHRAPHTLPCLLSSNPTELFQPVHSKLIQTLALLPVCQTKP
jgi:hypothetical protein